MLAGESVKGVSMSTREVKEQKTNAQVSVQSEQTESLKQIIRRIANRPAQDDSTADEIIDYGDQGLPR